MAELSSILTVVCASEDPQGSLRTPKNPLDGSCCCRPDIEEFQRILQTSESNGESSKILQHLRVELRLYLSKDIISLDSICINDLHLSYWKGSQI